MRFVSLEFSQKYNNYLDNCLNYDYCAGYTNGNANFDEIFFNIILAKTIKSRVTCGQN
jgi:hypothetical protein